MRKDFETEVNEKDNYEAVSRDGSKRNAKAKKKGKKTTTKPSTNDLTWHAGDDQLLRDAATIAFAYPSGYPLKVGGRSVSLPGICTIDVYPAVGRAVEFTDPINIAAQKIYSFIRHANSGHSNYDAPDLMIYLLAATSLYQEVFWAQRIYSWAFTYSQRNTYMNRGILTAMGIDVDDLIHNLANFRADLNVAISKISSFMIPNSMPIFAWMSFLYQNVYIDGPSIKDQLYFYRPAGFLDYQFNVEDATSGLVMKTIDYSTPLRTSDIITIINNSIDAMIEQEDFGIMGGDILKAYGTQGLIGITMVPEFITTSAIYDETVLHQFKNATCLDLQEMGITGAVRVDPDNNCIKADYSKKFEAAQVDSDNAKVFEVLYNDKVFTVDLDSPTPGDVMEISRLTMSAEKVVNADQSVIYRINCGTAIPGRMRIWYWDWDNLGNRILANQAYRMYVYGMDLMRVALLSRFKYVPAVWAKTSSETYDNRVLIFDIDNFVPLTDHDLMKMHRAATLHEYHVDSVALVTKAQ